MKRIQKPKLEKPIINGSVDEWGYILNDNIDKTTTFIDEVIQDSTEKENELSRLNQDKIDRGELPTFVKNTVDNYIETEVEPNLTNILDEHVTTVNKPDLDSYTDAKKRELDVYEKLKEGQLNTFTTQKESQLNSYVESINKPELDRYTETKKPIIDGYTNEAKIEITNHVNTKKEELDNYTSEKKEEITLHTTAMKQELTEKTNADKSILDSYTTDKKAEITAHTSIKLGELDSKTEENKGVLDAYEKTKELEISSFVETTVKPDITKHVDTEKEKSTTAITSHTNAEIERINASTNLDTKLDKGGYDGTARDLKSLIDTKLDSSSIVNDLTTGGADKVLSAEMGKKLNTDKVNRTDNTLMISRGNFDGRSTNLNSLVQSGLWKVYGMESALAPDYPSVYGWGLFKIERSEDSIVQTYIDNTDENTIYTRSSYHSGSTWEKWSKEINSADFSIQKSPNGYQKLASGLIIQWGEANNGGVRTRNFNIAFPTACVWGCIIRKSGSDLAFNCYNFTTTHFTSDGWSDGGSRWIAIGY